jgi:hypothetical protein
MGNVSCCTNAEDENKDIDVNDIRKKIEKRKGAALRIMPSEPIIKESSTKKSRRSSEYARHGGDYKIKAKIPAEIREVYNRYAPINDEPPKGFNHKLKREYKESADGMYEGYFDTKKGTRDGQGLMIYPDGAIYDGWWHNDLPHGKGLKILPTKDVYYGEFKEGNMHGFG